MIRKLFRFLVWFTIVAGVVAIVLRLLRDGQGAAPARHQTTGARRLSSPASGRAPVDDTVASVASAGQSTGTVAPPVPAPSPNAVESSETVDPPAPAAAPVRPSGPEGTAWVAPDFNGNCPDTHPVKVKQSSGIYHVPGGLSYDRTTPDRCYRDVTSAEADGYRPSKR